MHIEPWGTELLRRARVGHLATSTKNGRPHVVPVCYAFDWKAIYSAIDEKPKRVNPAGLRRVKNVLTNPNVALVVDEYSEDWLELRYIIVEGVAAIIEVGSEHEYGIGLLRTKYPQYLAMSLETYPIIKITPSRTITWRPQPSVLK